MPGRSVTFLGRSKWLECRDREHTRIEFECSRRAWSRFVPCRPLVPLWPLVRRHGRGFYHRCVCRERWLVLPEQPSRHTVAKRRGAGADECGHKSGVHVACDDSGRMELGGVTHSTDDLCGEAWETQGGLFGHCQNPRTIGTPTHSHTAGHWTPPANPVPTLLPSLLPASSSFYPRRLLLLLCLLASFPSLELEPFLVFSLPSWGRRPP